MAILLVVIGVVAGIALGQWFKVLVLVPVTSLALVGTIATGIARTDDVWSIALMAIAVMTAPQIGYLIGSWLRSFIGVRNVPPPIPPFGHPPIIWWLKRNTLSDPPVNVAAQSPDSPQVGLTLK